MNGPYPFRVGDEIRVSVRASVTIAVKLFARVRYIDGGDDLIEIDVTHGAGDRTNELKRSPDAFKKAGWVEHLTVDTVLNNARGRYYMMVAINRKPHHFPIAAGYIDIPHVPLGEFEPAIHGSGYKSWVEIFHDRAGNAAALDYSLAAANALRKVYGIAWYYHCSNDAANRNMNGALVSGLGGTKPTGFTLTGTNAMLWASGTNPALTANQEGAIISYAVEGKDGLTSTLDNGSQTIADGAAAPTPWPLWVLEDESDAIIRFPAITLGEANDRHSAYVLIEEWISP